MTTLRSSERHFQTQVEQLAKFYGWRVFHAPDNRPSGRSGRVQRVTPGFPDLVIVRDVALIFAELKTATGRVSTDQKAWMRDLSAVGEAIEALVDPQGTAPSVETYIWRPDDFDAINQRLAHGRHRSQPLYDRGAA